MRSLVVPVVALAMAGTGCADKFLAAKIAVSSGRAALGMAKIGVDAGAKAKASSCKEEVCKKLDPTMKEKYAACMKEDPTKNEDWKKCYAKTEYFVTKIWPQSQVTAQAGFDTAENAIKVAEQKSADLPVDIMPLIKSSACFVAQALEFLPEKYKKYVTFLIAGMKVYGCSKLAAGATPVEKPAP